MSGDDPFAQLERVIDQLAGAGAEDVGIPVDVVEDGETVEVTADLPGYEREDIDVRLRDGTQLEISAERSTDREETQGRVHRRERRHEAVSRSLTLPAAVTAGETQASYASGVLTVRLPKVSRDDAGRDIPVN